MAWLASEPLTCVLEGPTARRGTLMSNPPLGSFSPLKHGSLGGSRPPSQSQMVFRIACRTLGKKNRYSDPVLPLEGGRASLFLEPMIAQDPCLRLSGCWGSMLIPGPTHPPRGTGSTGLSHGPEVCSSISTTGESDAHWLFFFLITGELH